ncbi:hypothetical protein M758_10G043300 [Ceratodon purpureus]|nr:hypothetical protein M758_10G043300 [Ceratodon purpureus]
MEEAGGAVVEKNNFARKLGSADKKTREKGLSLLVLWLSVQKDVGEDELKKIWKGLFYCLWHSDKAHVQGDLINKLAGILESLDADTSLAFFEVFLTTMRREWGGIDRLRLDKFYRLLRQFLIRVFTLLQKSKWDEETIGKYMNALVEKSLLANDQYPALGVNLHFVDIFLTELRKFQPISAGTLRLMLQPCYATLASAPDKSLLKRVKECVFMPLLEEAQTFVMKTQDGSEVDENSFGPHVVSLPLGARLFELASLESTPQANRKILYDINAEYAKLDKLVAAAGIDLSSIKIGGGNSDIEMTEVRSSVPTRQSARQAGKRASMEIVDAGNGVGKKRKVKEIKDVPTPYDNPADSPILNLVEPSVLEVLSASGKKKNPLRLSSKRTVPTLLELERLEETTKGIRTEEAHVEQNDDQIVKVTEKKKKGKKKAVSETAQVQASSKKKGTKSVGVGKSSPVPAVATGGTATISEQSEQVQAGAGDLSGMRDADSVINVSVDDSVISNLEQKFASIAAETNQEARSNGSSGEATPTESSGKKKRKRGKAAEVTEPSLSENTSSPGQVKSNGVEQTPGSNSAKKKKVKFMLKNNIVWKPNNPLPPQSMRTPPSATPRGSALKKGVPAGPIRVTPTRKVPSRKSARHE